MKIHVSQQVYDQFGPEDRQQLTPVTCGCSNNPACESCEGSGTIYEWSLSAEDSATIQENLRSQGVPLGKIGTQ
jgi:hypothetical protein